MARKRIGEEKVEAGHGRRIAAREILTFLAFGAILLAFVSLWSLDLAHDPPFRPNAGGRVGYALARTLVEFVGWLGAYGILVGAAIAGIAAFFRIRPSGSARRAIAFIVLIAALTALEGVAGREGPAHAALVPRGGWIGEALATWMLGFASPFGAYLILGVVLAASSIVAGNLLASQSLRRARDGLALAGRGRAALARWTSRLRLRKRKVLPRRPAARPAPSARREEPSVAERLQEAPEEEDEEVEPLEEGEEEEAGPPGEGPSKRRKPRIRIPTPGETTGRPPAPRRKGEYQLPSIEFLEEGESGRVAGDEQELERIASKIEETLRSFKIEGEVVEIERGPVVTQYELALAAGTKVHKITNLSSELAMALRARRIRIVAPIPGKSTVGVEVPNPRRQTVRIREVFESDAYRGFRGGIPLLLGKDVVGEPIVHDLADMPHILIAGSTGSGKSVCLNSVITSILMTKTPEELKLILIDPKMVELSSFEGIPHLLCPVVTDMKKAPAVLEWAVKKMDERYEFLSAAGVRNIVGFNEVEPAVLRERLAKRFGGEDAARIPVRLPYIVLIVDELADLMMTSSKEVEGAIIRLAQKSRAVGIHCVLATQRPSVDVITGLIKSNMPCRISFHVSSKVDSRTILDRNGAETLLGKGDMLYIAPGSSELRRAQCAYVSDREIRDIVRFVREEAEPQYSEELQAARADGEELSPEEEDELYEQAVRIILQTQRGSATLLQRRLGIGYSRASRLIDLMAAQGIVSDFKGSKAREVYYTLEEWEAQRERSSG